MSICTMQLHAITKRMLRREILIHVKQPRGKTGTVGWRDRGSAARAPSICVVSKRSGRKDGWNTIIVVFLFHTTSHNHDTPSTKSRVTEPSEALFWTIRSSGHVSSWTIWTTTLLGHLVAKGQNKRAGSLTYKWLFSAALRDVTAPDGYIRLP